MNDIEICKKCIYYEPALFAHCQLTGQLCIYNCEFVDARTVIDSHTECKQVATSQLINKE